LWRRDSNDSNDRNIISGNYNEEYRMQIFTLFKIPQVFRIITKAVYLQRR
jgi:hypothetical protein